MSELSSSTSNEFVTPTKRIIDRSKMIPPGAPERPSKEVQRKRQRLWAEQGSPTSVLFPEFRASLNPHQRMSANNTDPSGTPFLLIQKVRSAHATAQRECIISETVVHELRHKLQRAEKTYERRLSERDTLRADLDILEAARTISSVLPFSMVEDMSTSTLKLKENLRRTKQQETSVRQKQRRF
jgi:hypothetical protein